MIRWTDRQYDFGPCRDGDHAERHGHEAWMREAFFAVSAVASFLAAVGLCADGMWFGAALVVLAGVFFVTECLASSLSKCAVCRRIAADDGVRCVWSRTLRKRVVFCEEHAAELVRRLDAAHVDRSDPWEVDWHMRSYLGLPVGGLPRDEQEWQERVRLAVRFHLIALPEKPGRVVA